MINYLKELKKTLRGSCCLLRVSDFQIWLSYISTDFFFYSSFISPGSQQQKKENVKTFSSFSKEDNDEYFLHHIILKH